MNFSGNAPADAAMIKVAQISYADDQGGAAIAAYRLHKAVSRSGVDSRMLVSRSYTSDPSVVVATSRASQKALSLLTTVAEKVPIKYRLWSPGLFSLPGIDKHPVVQEADVIILYWVAGGFLSIRGIGRLLSLGKPVIWRLSDMWPFTGGCHYSAGCTRYRASCGACPRLGSPFPWDLSRFRLRARHQLWNTRYLTVVAPSNWISKHAQHSSIFRTCHIEVIPTGVDVETYRPVPKAEARHRLGLPEKRHLVLFGAISSTKDPRKGFSYFRNAVGQLRERYPSDSLDLVVFGSDSVPNVDLPFRCHVSGKLRDDTLKALHYAACDVFVAPSLEDNLPNTAIEAMACGTPTVAFAIGGLPELIDHRMNGYLAKPLDTDDLAKGIQFVLEDPERSDTLSHAARRKVVANHNGKISAARYVSLLRKLVAGSCDDQDTQSQEISP